MASWVHASRLFAVPSKEAAVTLMLLCQAEGLHPMVAMRRFHVIQGRPAMRSDAMLAEFQRLGGKVAWGERSDQACEATFTHPDGGSVTVRWTLDDARRAKLDGKDNWRAYPRQMLTARVISEGVRTVLPGVVAGIYSPEESPELIADAQAIAVEPSTTRSSRLADRLGAPALPAPEPETLDRDAADDEADDLVDDDEPAPPRGETWGAFARRMVREYNDAWDTEQALAEVPKGDRTELLNQFQLANGLVTRAVEAGAIDAAVIAHPDTGKRDGKRAMAALESLFARRPRQVGASVIAYLGEKLAEAKAALTEQVAPADAAPVVLTDEQAREAYGPGADG
jgi:hypothetical protein